jgi:hypothetical protein
MGCIYVDSLDANAFRTHFSKSSQGSDETLSQTAAPMSTQAPAQNPMKVCIKAQRI